MIAKTRDGTEIIIGDDVTITGYHKACNGQVFTVFEINPDDDCESGHLCRVHLKGFPERILKSVFHSMYEKRTEIKYHEEWHGLDTNWLKKVT